MVCVVSGLIRIAVVQADDSLFLKQPMKYLAYYFLEG
jgi:hypothetical protein